MALASAHFAAPAPKVSDPRSEEGTSEKNVYRRTAASRAAFPPGQSAAAAPVGEPFRFDESAPRRPMSGREMDALLDKLSEEEARA